MAQVKELLSEIAGQLGVTDPNDPRVAQVCESWLTCQHCGRIGPDVAMRLVYIGGQGHVLIPYCINTRDCWTRSDRTEVIP